MEGKRAALLLLETGAMGTIGDDQGAHHIILCKIVYRLLNPLSFAAGQLAVFQGASEAPISGSIRAARAPRKNRRLAAAQRVALKMGRRLRCSSVTYRFRYAPSTASPARTALPAAHFERNENQGIYETAH